MKLLTVLLLVTLTTSVPLSAHARQEGVAQKPAAQPSAPESLDPLRQMALSVIEKEVGRADSYERASARILTLRRLPRDRLVVVQAELAGPDARTHAQPFLGLVVVERDPARLNVRFDLHIPAPSSVAIGYGGFVPSLIM